MKNTLVNSLIFVCFGIGIVITTLWDNHYECNALVTDISEDIVEVEDFTDNTWTFEGTGYKKGTMVHLKFFTNWTPDTRTDDIIIGAEKLYK